MSKFYKVAGPIRFLTVSYWLSAIPYDRVWDKYLRENIHTLRPAYWTVSPEIERDSSSVWVGDYLVWIGNDPGAFGLACRWDGTDLGIISGRASIKTQGLLRREIRALNKSLDICDAQATLQGKNCDDLLPIS